MDKRLILPIFLSFLASSLSGCGRGTDTLKGYFEADDAPSGAISEIDGNPALRNGSVYLSFEKGEDGLFGIYLKDDSSTIAYSDAPARIVVKGAESFGMYKTSEYSRGYDAVTQTNYGYHCISIVETESKSRFRVMDSYFLSEASGFSLNRKVTVIKAKKRDVGYESLYTLHNGEGSTSVDDFDFFLPSTVYKDAKYNDASALVTNLYNPQIYVKETRMGIPMAMAYSKNAALYFALVHADPHITVNDELGGGSDGAVNDDLEYGSLGFESERDGSAIEVAATFCYPCAEGPATFDSGAGWSRRFHEVSELHFHEYQIGITSGAKANFNDALVDSYESSYPYLKAESEAVDNELVYQQNIDCFSAEYMGPEEEGNQDGHPAGIPWELNLDPEEDPGSYSFQMGFVGQQTSVGAHLYRQGLVKGNEEYRRKGRNIVDFWCSSKIYPADSLLPYVWWEGNDKSHSSGDSEYASIYLRMLCDGYDGILDAYLYGKENGVDNPSWKESCIRLANSLVEIQNEDGSFNRAFDRFGGIPDATSFDDDNLGYDASDPSRFKLNTPIAIRFLARMFELTGTASYRDAAISAAEYSYTHIYEGLGKYVGGTCDNANVVDKEAAIYAMYGFRYAYALTGEEKYEKAMRHAACCALSWVFMYDFACPCSESYAAYCPYLEGNAMGASVIATGHAGIDCFAAYIWYDLFKIYEATRLEVYRDIAITLQNAVKHLSDYEGKRGYRYPCLMAEACQISDFLYKPTNQSGTLWLPWCGVGQVNPIVYTYMDYGVYSLEDVKL
ncbi:MAG: hypothetical protein K6F32_06020 [Bacilli bacterium]|nr:hypothetical protein [Bacilli bacterium]